ncbi:hypothetical protein OSB04_012983 [Centaurea solstitialis]|uniref:Uncharacterized protein n=1 Tax=Centaurea solstitialis TaxID=347529 RepID=A0AA38TE48_9ASTR|nr:hypothetical protein OSB04_012983 [Centaurea solstitialis]
MISTAHYTIWVQLYSSVAFLVCILAMSADLFQGFQHHKLWFPSRFFTINATSTTLITITLKPLVDITSPWPTEEKLNLSLTYKYYAQFSRLRLGIDGTENEHDLVEWVKPYIGSESFELIIDPRLEDPMSRPNMSEALEMVNQLMTTGVPSQPPPLDSLVSVVAIEQKMVFTHVKKTPKKAKREGESFQSIFVLISKIHPPFKQQKAFLHTSGDRLIFAFRNHHSAHHRLHHHTTTSKMISTAHYTIWVQLYSSVASLVCILAMSADLFQGFQHHKLWFPSRFFTINATSTTLITITLKLLVDITSPWPTEEKLNLSLTYKYYAQFNGTENEHDLVEWVKPYIGSESFEIIIDPRLEVLSTWLVMVDHPNFMKAIGHCYEYIGRLRLGVDGTENEHDLVEWVKPYIGSESFELIIDPRLEGNYSLESVQKLSLIANKCLSIDPMSRPNMSEALDMVNQLMTTGVPLQPPPLDSLVSVVAIEQKMVFTHVKKDSQEGEK